jgi:hypothetical protein
VSERTNEQVRRGLKKWPRALAGTLVADFVPLVGAVAFEWGLLHLLVVYWVETTVAFFRTAVEATFAGRPSGEDARVPLAPFRDLTAKRGGVRLHPSLPPVHPRNLPDVLGLAWGVAILAVASGYGLTVLGEGVPLRSGSLLLGTAVLTASVRESGTLLDHLRTRAYDDLSPRTVLTPRNALGAVVLFLAVAGAVYVVDGSATAEAGVAFAAVYTVRVLFDAYGAISESSRFASLVDTVSTDHVGEPRAVEIPSGEPATVFETDRRAVWLRSIPRGLTRPFFGVESQSVLLTAVGIGYLLSGVLGAVSGLLLMILGSVGVTLLEHDTLYGRLEYRVFDDAVVAFDTLLEEPQWRVSRGEIKAVETLDENPVRRVGNARSVRVESFDGSETLRCLTNSEAAIGTLS